MHVPIIIAIALGVVLFVVALIVWQRKAESARTDVLQQAAVAMGFSFEAEGDLDQIKALGNLPLFGHGHSRRPKNIMRGRTADDAVTVFDYQYTTGGGKESHTWRQTVALYPGAGRSLPEFVLAPENLLHKLGQLLGYQDIDFDSSPVFSSRYVLRGQDETAIRSAFTMEMRAFLEQEQGWTVEVQAGNVGIYRAGKQTNPAEIGAFLQQSHMVLRAITRR